MPTAASWVEAAVIQAGETTAVGGRQTGGNPSEGGGHPARHLLLKTQTTRLEYQNLGAHVFM